MRDTNKFCGFGAELAAMVAEEAFDSLKAPVRRVAAPDAPVPFCPPQEKFCKPDAGKVIAAMKGSI
nr:transketolase C-terminal domain-containing protein [Desulfocurvibacter africanus]